MGQKGHIMVQKGLKMHKKKAKNRVFGPKKKVFFLSGKGGYPPPLTDEFRLQQLSVMLTQFKLFDKLDRSNLPISF